MYELGILLSNDVAPKGRLFMNCSSVRPIYANDGTLVFYFSFSHGVHRYARNASA